MLYGAVVVHGGGAMARMRDLAAPAAAALCLGAFGTFSLAAVGAGCWVAAASGAPAAVWARNLGAWLAGAVLAIALARLSTRRAALPFIAVALASLVATLALPGLSGVHRWVAIGPVRLNCAETFLPLALVSWAWPGQASRLRWLAPAGLAAVLALQPDASQAAALAAGVVALALASPMSWRSRLIVAAAPILAAVVAVARPDPLQPVPEVEGILRLATTLSPTVAVIAVLLLAGAATAPAVATPRARPAALALCAYFAVAALATAVGAFPVPLVGMGVSPILGAWFGVGLLASLVGRASASPEA